MLAAVAVDCLNLPFLSVSMVALSAVSSQVWL
jgi:hypothetical protein